MGARGLALRTLGLWCVLAACLAFGVSAAPAAVIHKYLSQITEVPSGSGAPLPGPFLNPQSLAVDAGELYVADGHGSEYRVDKFDASTGAFLSQFPQVASLSFLYQGIAIGHATGETEVYVGGDKGTQEDPEGAIAVFGAGGNLQAAPWQGADTPSGAFGCFACGGTGDVAVDESASLSDWAVGDVYVADREHGVVDVFRPEPTGKEEYVKQLTHTEIGVPFSHPAHVAVDQSNGDVLVADEEAVDVFEPTALDEYVFVRALTGPPSGPFHEISDVAVGGSDGNIYVAEDFEEAGAVDEFNSNGAYLGRITGEGTPTGSFSPDSVAIDSDHVFVGVAKGAQGNAFAVDVFGTDIVIPDVETGAATGLRSTSEGHFESTLNGTVNLDEAGIATCQFDWGTSTGLGHTAPCTESVVEGKSPGAVPVHASLSGLQPDTTYYYRLEATNGHGTNPGESSQDQEFTTPGAGLHGDSVSAVRAESATFDARIDPNHAPVTYFFQYGTSAAYGAEVPSAPGAALGGGSRDIEAGQHVQGLQAATIYHYRLIAISELVPGSFETFYGPDQTFTTQAVKDSSQLPDGRIWEMVSPPQKEGAQLGQIVQEVVVEASANGNAFTDWASGPTEAEPEGSDNAVHVFFGRGPGGWVSKVITPPHSGHTNTAVGVGLEYRFFSEDLSVGAVQPLGPFTPLSPAATESTSYLHTDYVDGEPGKPCAVGCYLPLVTASDVPAGTAFGEEPSRRCKKVCGPTVLGGTPDLSHVVLDSRVALTANSSGGLYEWGDGKLTFLGVGELGSLQAARHTISADGSRVIFDGESEGLTGLLLRDTVGGQTIKLDLPQAGGEDVGRNGPQFMMASSDDSRIFFLDAERLTQDSTATGGEPDLYEYNLTAPLGDRLTDLTVDPGGHANASFMLGASEDGSYVYFTAAGALAAGASQGGCSEESHLCNLYVRHDGTTVFITALSYEDRANWEGVPKSKDLIPNRVSPDGGWLAFMSSRDLTGYDTSDTVSAHPDEEVYLYDAKAGRLVCASCNPTGARPTGSEAESEAFALVGDSSDGFDSSTWIASSVPAWSQAATSPTPYQRYLSDSGRLFFDSDDALVPDDVDGTQDVYEYEPAGVGDCEGSSVSFSERSGGCVSLISSGTSNRESAFLEASKDGGDVFFLTEAKLLPEDFDNAFDIYDAHACSTESPCIPSPPKTPPPCETGDSCKASPTPQPGIFGAPPSATFNGAGNVIQSSSGPVTSSRSLTRVQKLARALKVCRTRNKGRLRRLACERQARKSYAKKMAPVVSKKSAHKSGH